MFYFCLISRWMSSKKHLCRFFFNMLFVNILEGIAHWWLLLEFFFFFLFEFNIFRYCISKVSQLLLELVFISVVGVFIFGWFYRPLKISFVPMCHIVLVEFGVPRSLWFKIFSIFNMGFIVMPQECLTKFLYQYICKLASYNFL